VIAGLVQAFRTVGAASYAVDNVYEWVQREIQIEPASPENSVFSEADEKVIEQLRARFSKAEK
jgi:hypothetical protein